MRFGTDSVLRASERVEAHIERMEDDPEARAKRYRGFPVARTPEGFSKNKIDSALFMAECNLPDSAKILTRVSALIANAALRNGMTPARERPEELPAFVNVTIQELQRWLDALELLFAMRHLAECETLKFRPFPDGVIKVANQFGVKSTPTPVPPPELVLHLLEEAAKWVGSYSPAILGAIRAIELQETLSGTQDLSAIETCRSALPHHYCSALDASDDLPRFLMCAVEMLVTACWITIAAFTARRLDETLELTEDSLRGDDEAGWWLHCLIGKTTRQREWLPVPLIVARAFQTLLSISASARRDGESSLYRWRVPTTLNWRDFRQFQAGQCVNRFALLVGVPKHVNDSQIATWHWVPRQFRRFFAVLYFYRYEGADLAILSYFMRHFDMETTRGYVTFDPEAARIWRDVEKDFVHRLADSIASGAREVHGAMGGRLKKITRFIKDRLRKHLLVADQSLGGALQHAMERGGLVITPKAWVTCSCPRTHNAAKKARCRQGQPITSEIVGPSFADAGPTVCRDCRWAIRQSSKEAYSCQTQKRLEASINSGCGGGTLFRELEELQVVELRKTTGA